MPNIRLRAPPPALVEKGWEALELNMEQSCKLRSGERQHTEAEEPRRPGLEGEIQFAGRRKCRGLQRLGVEDIELEFWYVYI